MTMNERKATPQRRIGYGMKAIATYFGGMPVRRAFALAAQGELDSVFRMGKRGWAIDCDIADQETAKRARRACGQRLAEV